jgi:peptidoglycan hydrolase-like protein with peptidoglycan-binding domain
MRLQKLLNSDSSTKIAASGAGSPGSESVYFGLLTQGAVQRFQAKYGIVSSGSPATTGYGFVGSKTRAKLLEIFGSALPTSAPSTTSVSTSGLTFTKSLYLGLSDPQVKNLQMILNRDSETQVATSGVGSPGNETNYFGSLTELAVKKFQVKYGIAKTGDAGYGYVGPKTRAKLNELQ